MFPEKITFLKYQLKIKRMNRIYLKKDIFFSIHLGSNQCFRISQRRNNKNPEKAVNLFRISKLLTTEPNVIRNTKLLIKFKLPCHETNETGLHWEIVNAEAMLKTWESRNRRGGIVAHLVRTFARTANDSAKNMCHHAKPLFRIFHGGNKINSFGIHYGYMPYISCRSWGFLDEKFWVWNN